MKILIQFSELDGNIVFDPEKKTVTVEPFFFKNSAKQTVGCLTVTGDRGKESKELLQVSSSDGSLSTAKRTTPEKAEFDSIDSSEPLPVKKPRTPAQPSSEGTV